MGRDVPACLGPPTQQKLMAAATSDENTRRETVLAKVLATLDELREVNSSFPYTGPIKEWKKTSKQVVAFQHSYVPEEIIRAAGIVPIGLTGLPTRIPHCLADDRFRASIFCVCWRRWLNPVHGYQPGLRRR